MDASDSTPIEGAGIRVPGPFGPVAFTDAEGEFTFEWQEGTHSFEISHEQYKQLVVEDQVVLANETTDLGTLTLESWGEFYPVSGTIFLPDELHTVGGLYEVYITTGTFFVDGSGEVVSMLYDFDSGSGFEWNSGATEIPYSMTAPLGTFYIFVVLTYEDGGQMLMMMGIYDGVYDTEIPWMPNAEVTTEDNVFDILSGSFGEFPPSD